MLDDEYAVEANKGGVRTVYLMVQDIDGQVGINYGVNWGLEEGEELPVDIEDLSDAQYAVWQMIKAIKGIGDDQYRAETTKQAGEKPSGLLVPTTTGVVYPT